MAKFDPPLRHWDDDFDRRLASTFAWLREQVEEAQARVAELEKKDRERDALLAQAVADIKFYTRSGQ